MAYIISFFPYVPQKLLKDWYKLMKVRSSRPEVFCKKVFLEILPNYLCQNLFFNKVAGLKQLKLSAIFVEHIWEETNEINHFQLSGTGVFLWILWNFWEHLRWLLLESDDIVEHLPEKITNSPCHHVTKTHVTILISWLFWPIFFKKVYCMRKNQHYQFNWYIIDISAPDKALT